MATQFKVYRDGRSYVISIGVGRTFRAMVLDHVYLAMSHYFNGEHAQKPDAACPLCEVKA